MSTYCINGITKYGAQSEELSGPTCQSQGGKYPIPDEAWQAGESLVQDTYSSYATFFLL